MSRVEQFTLVASDNGTVSLQIRVDFPIPAGVTMHYDVTPDEAEILAAQLYAKARTVRKLAR
ncbi:hypothetical protein [Mycolicibacter minnesotensis]